MGERTPTVSVIVNTYNRAQRLHNCLVGLERQSVLDFEVVVADDGSSDETADLLAAFAREAPFPIRHVWHEDEGHRRAAILNRAIVASRGAYVLFTDCDAIARHDLIAQHLRYRRPDRMLCGGYYRLTEQETARIDPDFVRSGALERMPMGWRRVRRLYWQAFKNHWNLLIRKKNRPHNMGLNYSVAREHLLAINGYDETFRGWGNADGDVRNRLRMIGVEPASIWTRAIIYHQWHPVEKTKNPEVRARNRAWARRPDITAFCENGIVKRNAAAGAR
ncbi:MAG: glycosyltransferase [Planctomycetota bacterium]|nr:MAG: glycosyltransferase [Planctomycetota bacterium]